MAGVMTQQDIANEALDNVAKKDVLTLQSGVTLATRMTIFVNRAQLWIARRSDILYNTYTATTIVNQQSYALPPAMRRLFSIRLLDGLQSRKLTCVLPWEMDKKIPSPSSITTGRSGYYTPYGDTLNFELFPIPDAAYTLKLRSSVYPTDFTSPTAVSQYTNCDDALVAYSTMFAFRWLQELKDAASWEKFGDDIIDKVDELNSESIIFPDWSPQAEGFSISGDAFFIGEDYNNPFVQNNNPGTWWR